MTSNKGIGPRIHNWLEVITTAAVLVAALLIIWRLVNPPVGSAAAEAPVPVPEEPVTLAGAKTMGSPTASVVLLEFSDFECPFCSRFAATVLPTIKKNYVDTGKVLYAFRHFPLDRIHSRAEAAAQAGECAALQGRFWQMHDLLFQDPRRLEQADIMAYADQVGVNTEEFASCLTGSLIDRVSQDAEMANALGLTGTPAFLLGALLPNGQVKVSAVIAGGRPVDEFSLALDEALEVAAATQ